MTEYEAEELATTLRCFSYNVTYKCVPEVTLLITHANFWNILTVASAIHNTEYLSYRLAALGNYRIVFRISTMPASETSGEQRKFLHVQWEVTRNEGLNS
jgi:hypothetical protein